MVEAVGGGGAIIAAATGVGVFAVEAFVEDDDAAKGLACADATTVLPAAGQLTLLSLVLASTEEGV